MSPSALPRWSGDTLDLVVDFTTYVFVPAYAVAAGGLMPDASRHSAAVAIVVTGALYFADRRDEDGGQLFPRLSGGVERGGVLSVAAAARAVDRGGAIALLAVLTFVPIRSCIRSGCGGCARDRRAAALWAVLALVAPSHRTCARAVDYRGIVPDRRLFPGRRAVAGAQRS